MSLDEILNSGPEVLEKMSDQEVEKFFAPLLTFTRPGEAAVQKAALTKINRGKPAGNRIDHKALANAKALGIDLIGLIGAAKKK